MEPVMFWGLFKIYLHVVNGPKIHNIQYNLNTLNPNAFPFSVFFFFY